MDACHGFSPASQKTCPGSGLVVLPERCEVSRDSVSQGCRSHVRQLLDFLLVVLEVVGEFFRISLDEFHGNPLDVRRSYVTQAFHSKVISSRRSAFNVTIINKCCPGCSDFGALLGTSMNPYFLQFGPQKVIPYRFSLRKIQIQNLFTPFLKEDRRWKNRSVMLSSSRTLPRIWLVFKAS